MNGAAIASLISIFLLNLAQYLFLLIRENLQPFDQKTVLGLITGSGVLFISSLVPDIGHPLLNIAIRSTVVLILFGGTGYWLGLSGDANELFDQLRRQATGKDAKRDD